MNKKITMIIGCCCFCAVSAFAQGKLIRPIKTVVSSANLTRQVAAKASFVPKASVSSVVNGYLRTPDVTRFTLPTGEAMRAVRFSRNIYVKKENLFLTEGTLAVVTPAGKISLFGPDEALPAEIKQGMDEAFAAESPVFFELLESVAKVEASALPGKAWNGKPSYDGQSDLARDVDAYFDGKPQETLIHRVTGYETRVYRVPSSSIYYKPAGRSGRYLSPQEDLILFFPSQNDGQIIFNGVTDHTWRMFFDAV